MPQLDVSAWPPQLFWLAICFFALYAVVSRLIIPRTGGMIEKRKSTIDGDLAAAVSLKAESEQALKAYETSLADARSKAAATAAEKRNAVSAEVDAAAHKLDSELAEKAAAADKTIVAAKTKALAGLSAIATDISVDIFTQLTGGKITKTAAAAAVAKLAK
jgi:F-type H+-transporting ATPase subunit b